MEHNPVHLATTTSSHTSLPVADQPGQAHFTSQGWFEPAAASALRQHIRYKVLLGFLEQAEGDKNLCRHPVYHQAVQQVTVLAGASAADPLCRCAWACTPTHRARLLCLY